ncbi:hypothetical protein ACLOJK_009066 [Asimina triloba]
MIHSYVADLQARNDASLFHQSKDSDGLNPETDVQSWTYKSDYVRPAPIALIFLSLPTLILFAKVKEVASDNDAHDERGGLGALGEDGVVHGFMDGGRVAEGDGEVEEWRSKVVVVVVVVEEMKEARTEKKRGGGGHFGE